MGRGYRYKNGEGAEGIIKEWGRGWRYKEWERADGISSGEGREV